MPKGQPIPPALLQEILDRFDVHRKAGLGLMESYAKVGAEVGRSERVIGVIINRLRPTVGAARLYLRSKALRMAKKVVAKGSTAELMSILERPSIGVLDSVKRQEGGGGGFFLAVSVESCGAVKVGLGQAPNQAPAGEPDVFDAFALLPGETVDHGEDAREEERPIRRTVGRSAATQIAIQRAKERLEAARRPKYVGGRGGREEDGSVQGADGEPEAAGGG